MRRLFKSTVAKAVVGSTLVSGLGIGAGMAMRSAPMTAQSSGKRSWAELSKPFDEESAVAIRNKEDTIQLIATKDAGDSENAKFKQRMERLVRSTQKIICEHAENVDGGKIAEHVIISDDPKRKGVNVVRVIQDSKVFSKAGVNCSVFNSQLDAQRLSEVAAAMPPIQEEINKTGYKGDANMFTCSISLILHGTSPKVPTVHANWRYIEVELKNGSTVWWFGGGSDLTPIYVDCEDAVYFHQTLKNTSDKHDAKYYPLFKKWCDAYFFNPNRKEARGIGGVFFDHQRQDRETFFKYISDSAKAFPKSYFPIVEKHKDESFTKEEELFQQLRRGRYVEYNLIHDRGTQHGLRTQHNIESLLVSMPLTARWEYNYTAKPGSREEMTLQMLRRPVDWIPLPKASEFDYSFPASSVPRGAPLPWLQDASGAAAGAGAGAAPGAAGKH